jgi:hypothetical protein
MYSTWGVQRIDLRPALTRLLMAHTPREIELRAQAVFDRCVAPSNLRRKVADDPAEPRVQELPLPPGALELMRVRIAPVHDGGALGHPPIVLAQSDTLAFGRSSSFSIARWVNRASVGCATAFSCTVVSTTRSGSLVSIVPLRRLSRNKAAICSSPSCWR